MSAVGTRGLEVGVFTDYSSDYSSDDDVPAGQVERDLWKLTDVLWPHAVRTAVALRLADLLTSGPRDITELAKDTDTHPQTLDRLMRYLACRGIFARDAATGTYALNDPATLLCGDHPGRLATWLAAEGISGRAERAAARMPDVVRTGKPSYPLVFGRSYWADLSADPVLGASFDEFMAKYSALRTASVLLDYPWGTIGRVADVGGGNGSLLTRLLTAHPHLRGTLVERPAPAAAAAATLAEAGLGERSEVVPGSFFAPLPSGADLYLLASVLNDWSDHEAVRILRRCAEAAGAGGRTLIVEWHPAAEAEFTLTDLLALVLHGGRLRTAEALADLARRSGMSPSAPSRSESGVIMLECVTASTSEPG